MNTRELIQELQKQKEMLGNGFFNQELLEKYLDATFLKNSNEEKENQNEITIYGQTSLDTMKSKIAKIYPYTTVKPRFNRIKGNREELYKNMHNPFSTIRISVVTTSNKQKQKAYKQDKAA